MLPDNSSPRAFGLSGIYGGISGLGLALLCACGGSIEETDVDGRLADLADARGDQPAATQAPVAPAATPPAAQAATTPRPAASTPAPASSTPAPAAATPPPADDPVDLPASSETVSFEADVWPIFSAQCGPCHTVANIVQNIGGDDKDAAFADAVKFKTAIVADIQAGDMPQGTCSGAPGSAGCVTQAEFDLIKSWVDGGTPP
jgi:hypothetical protein